MIISIFTILSCKGEMNNKVVSVLSIIKGGEQLTDLYLQVKINGDVALLKAALFLMYQEEQKNPGSVFDLEFINEFTEDYDSFLADLKNIDFHEAVSESGISEEQIKQFSQLLIENKKITSSIETIRMEDLPSAIYFLKVIENKFNNRQHLKFRRGENLAFINRNFPYFLNISNSNFFFFLLF